MAAPGEGAATLTSSSSDGDDEKVKQELEQPTEELDFSSANFNPLLALYSQDVKVPFENIKSFPTVAGYEDAIKTKKERASASASIAKKKCTKIGPTSPPYEKRFIASVHGNTKEGLQEQATTSSLHSKVEQTKVQPRPQQKQAQQRTDSKSESCSVKVEIVQDDKCKMTQSVGDRMVKPSSSHQLKPSSSDQRETQQDPHKRNVFTRMAQTSGPLQLLSRCAEERLHVRVMTRAAVSVRSICRGYIVAFDKTFNMALIDVDEIYRRPPCLGKIRARRTHKLKSAQQTLKTEREEQREKFFSETDFATFTQGSEDNGTRLETEIKQEGGVEKIDVIGKDRSRNSEEKKQDVTKSGDDVSKKSSKLSKKERDKKSVYEGVRFPYSFYEREALMLGIPDENVEHRHVNQLFIRGENVVLVSIIDD